MTAESVPRKWRKSIFSFGIGWPNATKVSDPPASTPSGKRHNSVSFAPSPTSPTTIRAERSTRGYSTQSWRSSGPALHHGSVQSLVIRQKSLKRPPITSATLGRRPSIPSLPMAIVHAFTGRLRQGEQYECPKILSHCMQVHPLSRWMRRIQPSALEIPLAQPHHHLFIQQHQRRSGTAG